MVSDMVMIVSHSMHDNHKLESCHGHEKKQFHDFSVTFWELFIFQDFSMTTIFSKIFHDCGNPVYNFHRGRHARYLLKCDHMSHSVCLHCHPLLCQSVWPYNSYNLSVPSHSSHTAAAVSQD